MDDMMRSIISEIIMQKHYSMDAISTIYFGGGTPSIVDAAWIEKIIATIHANFTVTDNPEITLEANPDDINAAKVTAWQQAGVNRLSIGVQSFLEADLHWMNRAHNATQAKNCISIAQQNGITNLSIDLIYGSPNLSNTDWLSNIKLAMDYGIQHLSCYALTVEPHTALDTMIRQQKKEAIDPDKAAQQMMLLMEHAPQYGLEHYEISNLCKSGFRSKHNTGYWLGTTYIGIGPGAHSFNGQSRQWNVSNNALYISSIQKNIIPFEIEILSKKDKINEYIMTSLRTAEGMSLSHLQNTFHHSVNLSSYVKNKLLTIKNERAMLTNLGKLQADGIASDLFLN
jgi:oxygen-independent coproporphyrinogen-3 oxidase